MASRRYFLNLAYLGTPFRGSQRQVKRDIPGINDPTTVQGRLEMGLSTLKLSQEPIVFMASRTDAGVHALNASCHVDLYRYNDMIYEPEIVTLCLNKYFLKQEVPIRIINTKIVPHEFHCKHNAISRTYLYRILIAKHDGAYKSTFLHFMPIEAFQRSLFYSYNTQNFSLDRMREVAKMFEGFHDFRTFMGKTLDQDKYTRREILTIEIIERKREEIGISPFYSWPKCATKNTEPDGHVILDIYIKGKGFLYKQLAKQTLVSVGGESLLIENSYYESAFPRLPLLSILSPWCPVRRTVGTILTASIGQITPREVRCMLEVPSKHSWLPQIRTVPAYGLYLCDIEY